MHFQTQIVILNANREETIKKLSKIPTEDIAACSRHEWFWIANSQICDQTLENYLKKFDIKNHVDVELVEFLKTRLQFVDRPGINFIRISRLVQYKDNLALFNHLVEKKSLNLDLFEDLHEAYLHFRDIEAETKEFNNISEFVEDYLNEEDMIHDDIFKYFDFQKYWEEILSKDYTKITVSDGNKSTLYFIKNSLFEIQKATS